MDDGSRDDDSSAPQKQKVDHKRRRGSPYEPKPPLSEEQRLMRAERMKEFHRKTGKGTALGNARVRMMRKPK